MNEILIAIDVDLTLMVMNQNGDFSPSTVATFQYYVATYESFLSNIDQSSMNLMTSIYREHYDAFKLREPNDPNYIWVVAVRPKIISPDDFANEPWLKGECPIWEQSNLMRAEDRGFEKLSREAFRAILLPS